MLFSQSPKTLTQLPEINCLQDEVFWVPPLFFFAGVLLEPFLLLTFADLLWDSHTLVSGPWHYLYKMGSLYLCSCKSMVCVNIVLPTCFARQT